MPETRAAGTLFLTIFIVSASALAYEILLMRLFSIVQWHHFAYMVISLALLGYGISGTFITLFRNRLFARFSRVYVVNILLFAVTVPTAFLIAQRIPFNAQEMLWDPQGTLWLLIYFLLFSVPFFFAANAVGLALSFYRKEISVLYAADMAGAGAGTLLILTLFYIFHPTTILQLLSAAGFFAAALAAYALKIRPFTTLTILFLTLLPFTLPTDMKEIRISPYKSLSQTLQIMGTRIADESIGPFGIVTVVESPLIPLRYAPGVSLRNEIEPPEQLGIFVNGEWSGVITRYDGERERLKYLDYLTSAFAYHAGNPKKILIVGADGGMDVLQALYFDAKRIDAVEMDATIVSLVKERFADFAGHIYENPHVALHVDEARGFVLKNERRYDLIQFALLDAYGSASSGLYALSENYLYTVEAFRDYLRRLRPGGYLSVTRWIKLPPRDMPKLVATAIEALSSMHLAAPQKRLMVIRGWQTATLLVKNGIVTAEEIRAMQRFCESRSFDPVYYDGMPPSEANRYNILERPFFHTAIQSLLTEPDFFDRYRFDIRPTTDDRPYFNHFFRWETLPDILSLRGAGGLYLMEWGYLILVATLLVASVLSGLLILLPAMTHGLVAKPGRPFGKSRTFLYFFALGIAFMFLEIAFMQKYILFISHPVFSAAIVLSAFLFFAGLGSAFSHRFIKRTGYAKTLTYAFAAILLLALTDLVVLDLYYEKLVVLPFYAKALLTVVTVAPLAFAMGIPFPLGLSYLARENAPLVPWAWGVNGFASVISAIVATLLAIDYGFTAVILSALLVYGGALWVFPKRSQPTPPSAPPS